MKFNRELLLDFIRMGNPYIFKLKNGQTCYGDVEAVGENFLQFCPLWDEHWKDSQYEKNYEDDSIQFIIIPIDDIDFSNLFYWDDRSFTFRNPRWNEQQGWLNNEVYPGYISVSESFLNRPTNNNYLKKVGYWQSEEDLYYPHPKYLVEPGWREDERARIVNYLKSGHRCGQWCGYSYCRFGCFSFTEKFKDRNESRARMDSLINEIGCHDLTDGEWMWPQGLAHYIENHEVCLPDLFISTMQKNSWVVPQDIQLKASGINSFYWINWAIEYVKTKSTAGRFPHPIGGQG